MSEISDDIRNGAYAFFATQPIISLEGVTAEILNELIIRAYAAGHRDALAAKDAEIAKLKAALGPFADECDHNIGDTEDDSEAYSSRFGRLSVGDFRQAVAALEEKADG